MTFTAVIVTSCTQRKSVAPLADVSQLPPTVGIDQLAGAWMNLIAAQDFKVPATSLYQGRSIRDTVTTASILGAHWYAVSAGLGLVQCNQPITPYECTVAPGSDLGNRLKMATSTPSDWWKAITARQPHPISQLVGSSPTLLALPSSYLRMVADDLAQVPIKHAANLRIFTSTLGTNLVPQHLAHCVMPYDDRLESIHKHAGTNSDFPQRALRHFVECLGAAKLPIEEARSLVSSSLLDQPHQVRLIGKRISDEEILEVLTAEWTRHLGSSTRLLRYLRDEARIACEQKRFARLWKSLAIELSP